jgi:hypothetical protein
MPRPRRHLAPLALALDGSLLLSVSGRVDSATLARIALLIPENTGEVFVGVRLNAAQAQQALSRLDDASAEAAARILGERAPSGNRRRKSKRNR